MNITTEDYIKRIYLASRDTADEYVSLGRVSVLMQVTAGTVTTMMKHLDKQELVLYKSRQGVQLTAKGRALALKMVRRHRLLELFLVEKLGYGWEEVHEEAEQMEHAVSPLFISRIDAMLGFPKVDPHGSPIPTADGDVETYHTIPLNQAKPGLPYELKVVEDQKDLLIFLESIHLKVGSKLSIKTIEQGSGLIQLESAERPITISMESAKSLHVIPL